MPKKAGAATKAAPKPASSGINPEELNIRFSKSDKKWAVLKALTPVGVAAWPWLNRPKTIHTPEGTYEVEILLSPEEAQPMVDKMDALAEAYQGKYGKADVVSCAYREHTEKDLDGNEVPTGLISIKAKMKAVRKVGNGQTIEQKPKIVDAKTNPMVPVPSIGAGTRLRVGGDLKANVMADTKLVEKTDGSVEERKINTLYVSFQMEVVQVVELKLFESATPQSYGMGEVEGGYDFGAPADLEDGGADDDAPSY